MAVNLELADTLQQKEHTETVRRGHWSRFSLPFKRSPSTVFFKSVKPFSISLAVGTGAGYGPSMCA